MQAAQAGHRRQRRQVLHRDIDFLGGLAGYLAAQGTGEYGFEVIRQAVAHGSVLASFTCEAFSTRRLEEITRADVETRLAAFRRMTAW